MTDDAPSPSSEPSRPPLNAPHSPQPAPSERACRRWLDLAARHALRASGYAEPNPLVGCVVVPTGERVEVGSDDEARALAAAGRVGVGHHRIFGGAHAEPEALAACARLGLETRGATAFVTLEPCDRWGKTGPCSEALKDAGVSHVVYARKDPAQDGARTLAHAGVDVIESDASARAIALSASFVHRLETGRPWVIAKWAQTLDGRSATSSGESQWLTGERARRSVHQLRARVDAILTGIGTVKADDPSLTARGVTVRREALRVVIDPRLELPSDSRLVLGAREGKGVLAIAGEVATIEDEERLRALGVGVERVRASGDVIDLGEAMRTLAREHNIATLMTECGARLLGALADADLVDELRAYVAPMAMGDPAALPAFSGRSVLSLDGVERWGLAHHRRLGDDLELRYTRRGR